MSTYLLAWCVGEFESSEPAWANGKELRIWSVPGKNAFKSYALKCAAYGVEWYERTLGVPYFGGDKIDMIAIPEFRSGAMENTGLITYRATALLVDEPHATVAELQRVAEVVFHELAHMWFGNLVTMAWWDGLPLNESNATIFAYLVMADFQPEWHIFNSFGLHRAAAFALDSLNSTHPCWAPVGHPDEVEQRFDKITYEKGGSLEFQIHQYVGDDPVLRRRARLPGTRYSHGNAEVTDLWDALEEGARKAGLDVPVRRDHGRMVSHGRPPRCDRLSVTHPGLSSRSPRNGSPSWAGRATPRSSGRFHSSCAAPPRTERSALEKLIFAEREQEVSLQEGLHVRGRRTRAARVSTACATRRSCCRASCPRHSRGWK